MQELKAVERAKPSKRGRGRPRDPDLENKVFQAAIDLYSEAGWSGFNFDQISKMAGVGKAAIYRRWPKREDLLRHAFELRWEAMGLIDQGSLREDLIELARLVMSRFNSEHGGITLNFAIDTRLYAEVREVTIPFSKKTLRREMLIIDHAKQRGEIPEKFNGRTLIHAITGACQVFVTSRVNVVNDKVELISQGNVEEFIIELVDMLLGGVDGYKPAL